MINDEGVTGYAIRTSRVQRCAICAENLKIKTTEQFESVYSARGRLKELRSLNKQVNSKLVAYHPHPAIYTLCIQNRYIRLNLVLRGLTRYY